MKHLVLLLICLVCISCKKEENTVEVIFLENLKESTKDYQFQIDEVKTVIETRYNELRMESLKDKPNKINVCSVEVEKHLNLWDSFEKDQILKDQILLVNKLNSFETNIQFEKVDNDKLSSLPKVILIEYFKNKLYKSLLNNYINILKKCGIYCGTYTLSKKGLEQEIIYSEEEKKKMERKLAELKYALDNFDPNISYK